MNGTGCAVNKCGYGSGPPGQGFALDSIQTDEKRMAVLPAAGGRYASPDEPDGGQLRHLPAQAIGVHMRIGLVGSPTHAPIAESVLWWYNT